MKKKNGKTFDISSLKIDKDVPLTPRSQSTAEMFDLLIKMSVGDSIKMPMELQRTFVNAKTTLKRLHKRVIIYRNIDKYNFRCWRKEDGTVLTTRRQTKKK